MKKHLFLVNICIILFSFNTVLAQTPKKIIIEHSDFADINQLQIPDAALLTGNVRVNHDGAILTCNKAYWFQKENYIKAFGNVQIIQGDTLTMTSKYAEYNGNIKQAYATGDVILKSPEMSLVTDTLNFNRNSQEAFYSTGGLITNKGNTLKSKSGKYYVAEKKYQFLTSVTVKTPENTIKSNHLDYYTNSGHSYLLGPSTIIGKDNKIYTENGFYDTKKDIARLQRNSKIEYNNRLIEGDSIFYNKKTGFASATNNVKITDTINKIIVKGHYAEIYKFQDSVYVTKRALAISLVEKDSVYIHAQKLMITGKENNRIIRGFKDAKFYKLNLSGKCDSIHSNQKIALTKLIGKPILWNFENQMTGDLMHLIGNNKTQQLDSLKVLNNAFIVSKDTIGTGYNQVKGQNLYGKFKDKNLDNVDIVKNTEVIYYMRNDDQELIGINKSVCSKINLTLDKNRIDTLTLFEKPDSDIYPEKDLPENARKLRGFIWRGDERIKTKEDLFTAEENEMNDKIIKESNAKKAKADVPMKVRKETLEYNDK
ncbi:Organic solvent tolerance-like, N-terminal [Flavobacteriaceae bacterium]